MQRFTRFVLLKGWEVKLSPIKIARHLFCVALPSYKLDSATFHTVQMHWSVLQKKKVIRYGVSKQQYQGN